MNSLMLHEPAMRQSLSGCVIPVPMAHAEMSNRPPATGVPSFSPVSAAAYAVTVPQISPDPRSGGSLHSMPPRPNAFSTSVSYFSVLTFIRLRPE